MSVLANIRVDVAGDELVVRIDLTPHNRAALLEMLGGQIKRGGDRRSLPDLPPIGSGARDEQDREIARRYLEDLESIPDIAHAYECGATAIESALNRQGVKRRSVSEALEAKWERRRRGLSGAPKRADRAPFQRRALSDDQALEAKRLYVEALQSTTVLGEKYQVTPATIANTLNRLGVKLRTRHEAAALAMAQRQTPPKAPSQNAKRDCASVAPPKDPRAVGAPLRVQTNEPPATERLRETRASTKTPAPVRQKAVAVHSTTKTVNPPPKVLVRSGATDTSERDAEIERRYVKQKESANQIDYDLALTPGTTKRVLSARGVKLRTVSEAAKLAGEQRAKRREEAHSARAPKLKPLEVPADAKRKVVPLEELRPIQRLDAPPRPHKAALKETKERSIKIARQKKAAALREPMTAKEMQDAVSKFFKKGGTITEIKTAPVDQQARPAVGMRDGRKH